MTQAIYIHGLEFSSGEAKPLVNLRETEQISDSILEELAFRGVETYCDYQGDIQELYIDAILRSISSASLEPSDIQGIVFANAMPALKVSEEFSLLNRLHEVGIRTNTFVGLQFLHCCGFVSAAATAADMVRINGKDNIIVLLGGHVPAGEPRVRLALGTVYGDGAAACIVSSRPSRCQWITSDIRTEFSSKLPNSHSADSMQSLRAFENLRIVARNVLSKATLNARDLSALCSVHGSRIYLEVAGSAVGVNKDRIIAQPLEKYGHIFSCDNIIALYYYLCSEKRFASEYAMVVGWSIHIAAAAILKLDDGVAVI